MTQIEYDKIINLMKHGALQGIDTGRLDGKCEDVIPIEDAIAIVDSVMFWEEMEKYTELTGEDATHVPIMKIRAYLDGYKKGTEVLDKIKAEIENEQNPYLSIKVYGGFVGGYYDGLAKALKIIDRHINGEGSGEA